MASRLTVLYYAGSKWNELKNKEENSEYDANAAVTPTNKPYSHTGGSPVLAMELEDDQGAPLQIRLTLNNRQSKPLGTFTEPNNSYTFGEDPLVNPQIPQFHGMLNEFTRIIVYETDTFMTLFVGRIIKREETYDLSRGSTLTLTCRDALYELGKNVPFEESPADEERELEYRLTTTREESGSNNDTLLEHNEVRNHYHIIKQLIERTSYVNTSGNIEIGFTDTDKIESWTTSPKIKNWTEESIRITDPNSKLDVNKIKKNTLTEIQDQASAEVWAEGDGKMGFTFHLDATRLDPRLQANGATLLPQQDFVYSRRGYKNTNTPNTRGLAVKYAVNPIEETSGASLTVSDKARNMLQDGYEFEAHGAAYVSHLVLTYPYTKERDRGKPAGANPKGQSGMHFKFGNYITTSSPGATGTTGRKLMSAMLPSTKYWDMTTPDNWMGAINGYTWDMYDVLGTDTDTTEEEETLEFALIYVEPFDSNDDDLEDFSCNYADGDISQTWPNSAVSNGFLKKVAAGEYKSRTFHQVSSLHTKIGPLGRDIDAAGDNDADETGANVQQVFTSVTEYPYINYGTKTWIGNVQIQGKDEEGNHYVIVSSPQEDVIRTLTAGDVLYERSHYYEMDHSGAGTGNPRGAKIKFVSYPAADRGYKQTKKVHSPKATYQDLRNRIENEFLKANNKETKRLRTGTFRIKDYPHITMRGTAGLSSSGSTLYPSESFSGGVTPASYGMKRGCAVQSTSMASGSSDKFVGFITLTQSNNVTASLWKEDTLAEASPSVGSWQSGDTYSIYAQIRAGDSIRIENLLLGIAGDFLVESIYYSWANGQVYSELEVIGMNDKVVFKSRPSTEEDPEIISEIVDPIVIEQKDLGSGAYTAKGVLWWHDNENAETPTEVSDPLKKDYNTFSWSGGSIVVNSGRRRTYVFKAGDTDEALVRAGLTTFNDSNDPGAPNPPNTCMGPYTQYILYLDRDGVVDDLGRYSLNIDIIDYSDFGYVKADSYIELAYLNIGTLEAAGSRTIGKPGTSFYSRTIQFPKGIPNIQFLYVFDNTWGVASNIMNPGFSFNQNSLTSALLKPGARPWASNISIRKHTNENYNQIMWDNGTSNGASTLTYGDNTSISIAAGTKLSGLADNTTNYMYIDTSVSTTPQFTTVHSTAMGDNNLLLALIVVGADTNQTAPTILPFNSKTPTLNAVAIAANAVIADHIQAGSLDAKTITLSGTDGKIRTSDGVNRDESGNPTGSGIIINNAGIVGVKDNTKQFEIRATTGKAEFGEGACLLDDMGLWMKDQQHPINLQHGTGSTADYYYSMWGQSSAGHNRILFASRTNNGTYITDPEVNYLAPHIPGEIGLGGPQTGPWGTIYANTHYISIKASAPSATTATNWGALYIRGTTLYMKIGTTEYSVGSGSATVSYPLTATDGSAGSPSYTFSLDPNTGIFRLSNDKLGLVANGQPIILDGTSGAARLGIGTSTPSHLLHVNGVALSTQATWATSSDERVKENIVDMEPALDTLLQLKPRRFNFKDSYRPNRKDTEVGFIAQEVKEVVATAVQPVKESYGWKKSDEGVWVEDADNQIVIEDFEVLDTSWLLPMLVKAVQELKSQNDALTTRIDTLEGN